MKKFIAVLSMVAMIGTLAVGCGKSNEESKGEDAKTEASGDWDSSMDITIVSREDGSGTRGAVSYTHLDVYKRQILVGDLLAPGMSDEFMEMFNVVILSLIHISCFCLWK